MSSTRKDYCEYDMMTESFTIREFTSEDIKHVVFINKETLPENYPDQFFLGLHYHAPKAFLVAELDNEIVGYIMCRIERGISSSEDYLSRKDT